MPAIGWKLDRTEREALLQRFAPEFPDVVADHVTLKHGVGSKAKLPASTRGEIVGSASDGEGVQALIVRIAGTTDRPGSGSYHITWSLDRKAGRAAKDSNDLIEARGWAPIEPPVPITLTAARF